MAAERAVRELHHDRPGAPLPPGHREYRRADPAGRWAEHGVRVYVLPGLRRRFDQLIRVPGARELALLYFVTRDRDGVRAVFVDPATLARAAKLPRSARALIAERELVRIVNHGLPEPAVQAMPLPSPRKLRRLAARPYRLGVPEPGAGPGSAAELGALISEYLATQPHWRGGLIDLVDLLGVDVDAVHAAVAAHPHLNHYTSVLAGPAEAGFRPTLRDGRLVVRLPSTGGAELLVVGRHIEPNRQQGLDALATAVIRLRDLRLMHRDAQPAAWQGIPAFELIATAWRNAGAPVVDAGDLRIHRGVVAGHGLTLVTWQGELINYYPTAMATAALPAPDRIAAALAAVVRVTGELTDAALTAVATGVVVAPETVLSVAHAVVGVDPATVRVDGLPVSRIETLRADEFAVRADLPAESLARTGAAGVPVYDGMVDLVLLTVPGLARPAARLRATPVPAGTSLTAAGHPVDRWTQNHGPVTESGVHVVAAMALSHGFSGGPALDPDGAVAGIQSYGSGVGPANFIGPELIAAFLATLRPRPAGARKPPGSHLLEQELGPALRGDETTPERKRQLGAQLTGEVRLPGERAGTQLLLDAESLLLDRTGRFGGWVQRRTRRGGPDRNADPRRVLKMFVALTGRLLRDEPGLRRQPIPPLVWRELAAPIEDPTLRPLAVDAGFRWEDGKRHLFVTDAGGAVHEVVESTLAGFAGFPEEVRHAVAVLAERAADPAADPASWLTTRTLRDLDRLARENPAALDRLIADHARVLGVDIEVAFAGLPAWRDVARAYVEQFREAAVARIPHRDVPRALVDREAGEALRELRELVRDLPGFTRADRRYVRQVRAYWNDEVYDGVIAQAATRMKRTAARHRLDVTDGELLALAARREVWQHVLGLNVPDEPRALVEQVWERLLPAELREEFPLFR